MADNGDYPHMNHCKGACHRVQLYQAIVFATPVLFASLLLLLFCLLYMKRRRVANIHSPIRGQFFAGGPPDSPSWECGLSKSFRQRLPIVLFDEKFSSICQDTQCTVCLSDYQVSEKILQLPICKHSFHVQCIDEWLAKNVTCPICRTSVLADDSSCSIEVQCSEDGPDSASTTEAEHGIWEERVVSEVQELSHFTRIHETSDDVQPSEFSATFQHGRDFSGNMERS
ncbi:hypothetical protein KP509_38G066400 [Ceratopteris richardii]|uniref:RING-type E3 ubiquitin transferase n=1 Tax=Ceratopteris richardii TaxID=49495 RepID=A0A8T2Q6M4_CERRI|nr:hypothetical protein KP509_38G066400 [Ceratopteris richardii]